MTQIEQPGGGLHHYWQESRFIKEYARETGVKLGGVVNWSLESTLLKLPSLTNQLEQRHANWLQRKRGALTDYLGGISESIIRGEWEKGLQVFFVQRYRTFKQHSPDELDKLKDERYLEGMIGSFTLDFVKILQKARKLGVSQGTALKISRYSYKFNPSILNELVQKYPEFGIGTIAEAIAGHPSDPHRFIEGVAQQLPVLSKQFADLEPHIIMRAATHFKDSQEFLATVQSEVPITKEKYPQFEEWVIIRAVMGSPKSPDSFMQRIEKQVLELQNQYPDLNKWVIVRIVVKNSNPGEVLELAQEKILTLTPQYSDLGKDAVFLAVINHPSDPEGFLSKARQTLENLSQDNPGISKTILLRFALSYTDAAGALKKFLSKVESLVDIFPEFAPSIIQEAALKRPGNTEQYLTDMKLGLVSLSVEFPEMDYSTLVRASLAYEDPRRFLLNLREQIVDLKPKFPQTPPNVIKRTVERNPGNPEQALNLRSKPIQL